MNKIPDKISNEQKKLVFVLNKLSIKHFNSIIPLGWKTAFIVKLKQRLRVWQFQFLNDSLLKHKEETLLATEQSHIKATASVGRGGRMSYCFRSILITVRRALSPVN